VLCAPSSIPANIFLIAFEVPGHTRFRRRSEVFMSDAEHHIRELMTFTRDAQVIELWLGKQPSPHTRGCYQPDADRLLDHVKKPLARITLADLQSFAQMADR
jgi:hypothetical protein